MRRKLALTDRVVWAVTATVALLVGLQSVLALVALHVQEDELTDTMLRREVQLIVAHTGESGLTPTGPLVESTLVSAWLTRNGVGDDGIPGDMRRLPPGMYQFSPDGKTLHVAVVDTDDGRLTVVLDATQSEARVLSFGVTLLAIWMVCVLTTVWIGRRVAAGAVAPIVAATRNIAHSGLVEAPSEHGRSDEAGVLIETFNRFRDRVDDMLAREREFAANLDHEIRTPLTTIRTDAELLTLEAAPNASAQPRLHRIVAAVDEITATMAATLSYSAGRTGQSEAIELRGFLRETCASFADRAAARGLRMTVDVEAGEIVQADRQALLTIVRNILRNALEHAAPAQFDISGDRSQLTFTDDGPGIAPTVLAHVFDRHRHGHRVDEGAAAANSQRGLGLAIASRLCEMQGWQLTARAPAVTNVGTVFVLSLSKRDRQADAP